MYLSGSDIEKYSTLVKLLVLTLTAAIRAKLVFTSFVFVINRRGTLPSAHITQNH